MRRVRPVEWDAGFRELEACWVCTDLYGRVDWVCGKSRDEEVRVERMVDGVGDGRCEELEVKLGL